MSLHQKFLAPLLLVALLTQAACAGRMSGAGVVQYFDEESGTTVVALAKPLIYAAEATALAANARDYIYLGPAALSSGEQEFHYLWLAEWSSIDRQITPLNEPAQANYVLHLDGEPMPLTRAQGSNRLLRSERRPYTTPIASPNEYFFTLTRRQLIRIARANVLSVEVLSENSVREYKDWRAAGTALQAFARYLESGDEAELKVVAYAE